MTSTWWWGSFPPAGQGTPTGQGEGVWTMPGAAVDATLGAKLPAPSWLVPHPDLPLLYTTSEADDAAIYALDISDPTDPRVVGSVLTGGSIAGHMILSRDTLALYVAVYGTGEVCVIRLGADGLFDSDRPAQMLGHEGSGPVTDRQEGAHPHFVAYAPDGRTLLVPDLGTDEIRRYDVLPDGLLRADGIAATLPPGAGPRHLAVVGDRLHLLCELDNKLRTLAWDGATRTAELIIEQPLTHAPLRTGEGMFGAHIEHVAGHLIASVRGADVLVVFDLDGNGLPTHRGAFDSGGEWPRHFAVIEERVVVANQRSHSAAVFDIADVLTLEAPKDDYGDPLASGVAELPHTNAAITSPAFVCAG